MNRRGFLSRILPTVGVAGVAATTVSGSVSDLPDRITREGVSARWLGWREGQESDRLFGVWIYTAPDGEQFYSTTGGCCYLYREGDVFDLTTRRPCRFLTSDTSDDDRRASRQAAYDRGWEWYRAMQNGAS